MSAMRFDAMRPLYARDPFNFDDQHMEKMKITLDAGDLLRVACECDTNGPDTEVTFRIGWAQRQSRETPHPADEFMRVLHIDWSSA
jgi:hypothetical protein